ncbi:hypothetical protein AYO40_06615 [Planctomycetaceae bacterium SCGC AG-212-D15]|nr:hypothetical protein AYO40_06615 [Planctomycetaceae bacterium SCGC AG-212-D15]
MKLIRQGVGVVLAAGLAVGLLGCGKRVAVKSGGEDEKPPVVQAGGSADTTAEAAKQEGKTVTVELTARYLGLPRDGIVLAERDPAEKDFAGLAIFIPTASVARFGNANGNDVGEKFFEKKIRVAGKVGRKAFEHPGLDHVERKIIEVTEPGQILVVEK